MIRLDTVNRSLTLFLGGAQVSAPLQIVVSYSDQTAATYLGASQLSNSNGVTAVTICAAPAASTIRDIDMVTVLNTDTGSQVVTIQLLDTATTYKIISTTLLVGEKLTYTHGSAWQVVDNSGNLKTVVLSTSGVNSFSAGSTGLTPSTATTGAVTLGGTLAVASGGTGTSSPSLVAGTNVSITGTWPNQTVNSTASGSVTSVTGTSPVVSSGGATPAISLAASYGDTQNPYASKTANFVLAAPNGVAGVPTFRAIVAADIPTLNQNTTGTAANVTGIVAVANGGTGVTTSTGTGNTVLSTSPTLTTPIITALDTQFTLQDDVDPTKQANFELSAITTATTGTYTLPAASATLAGLGTVQTFSANQTFSGNVSMTSSSFTRTATTQAWLDGSMTTAAWTVGGTAQTGIITLGRSTAAQTLNIANGATATATTKTVNIGTAGLSGSTTAINIGSAVLGATTTTSVYGDWTFNTAIGIASGGTGQTTAAAAFNALSPVTTTGDLIIGNGTNSATRLPIGANTYVLTSNGTTATWAAGGGGGGSSAYTRTTFTATAGQTAFTVTYAVGYLQIYVNGVLLTGSDYTATSGTGFTLNVACAVGDIVEALVITTSVTGVTTGKAIAMAMIFGY